MLPPPPPRIEPWTSDSKSNTPFCARQASDANIGIIVNIVWFAKKAYVFLIRILESKIQSSQKNGNLVGKTLLNENSVAFVRNKTI